MSIPFDLSEELLRWKEEYGDVGTGKGGVQYPFINWRRRKDLLVVLLNELKELGAEKEYFKRGKVRDDIVKACTAPKPAIGKKAFNTGMSMGYKDLDRAILEVFGTESQHFKKTGKVRAIIKEQEDNICLELKIAGEVDAAVDLAEKNAPAAVYNIKQNTTQEAPAQPPVVSKEFDGSKYREGPKNEWEVDPDFAILLGLDKKDE